MDIDRSNNPGLKPEAGSWRPPDVAAVNILDPESWGGPESSKRETKGSQGGGYLAGFRTATIFQLVKQFCFLGILMPSMSGQFPTSWASAWAEGVKLVGGPVMSPALPGEESHTCLCYYKALFVFSGREQKTSGFA